MNKWLSKIFYLPFFIPGIIFLLIIFLIWGAFLGKIILLFFYLILPDQWVNPIADFYFKIFPETLHESPCEPDYMGGCN